MCISICKPIVWAERVAGMNTNEIEVEQNVNKKKKKKHKQALSSQAITISTTMCMRSKNHVRCVYPRRRSHEKWINEIVCFYFGGTIETFLKWEVDQWMLLMLVWVVSLISSHLIFCCWFHYNKSPNTVNINTLRGVCICVYLSNLSIFLSQLLTIILYDNTQFIHYGPVCTVLQLFVNHIQLQIKIKIHDKCTFVTQSIGMYVPHYLYLLIFFIFYLHFRLLHSKHLNDFTFIFKQTNK